MERITQDGRTKKNRHKQPDEKAEQCDLRECIWQSYRSVGYVQLRTRCRTTDKKSFFVEEINLLTGLNPLPC